MPFSVFKRYFTMCKNRDLKSCLIDFMILVVFHVVVYYGSKSISMILVELLPSASKNLTQKQTIHTLPYCKTLRWYVGNAYLVKEFGAFIQAPIQGLRYIMSKIIPRKS